MKNNFKFIVSVCVPLFACFMNVSIAQAEPIGANSVYRFADTWTQPVDGTQVSNGDAIIYQGTYKLPPGWVINMYAVIDGVKIDSSRFSFDNTLSNATATAPFVINAGVFPSGPHTVVLTIDGAELCALAPPSCTRNDTVYRPSQNYSKGSVIVSPPNIPILQVTPSTNPAFDIANTPLGVAGVRSFTVTNIGGADVDSGGMSIDAPFVCSGCNYVSIAPGESRTITFELPAGTPVGSYSGQAEFTCSPNCVTVTREIRGNVIPSAIPPQITLSDTELDFGSVLVGHSAERTVTITNSGGGILSGAITIPPGYADYTCEPDCAYSILAGDSETITIRFTPLASTVGEQVRQVDVTLSGASVPANLRFTGIANNNPNLEIDRGWWGAGILNLGDSDIVEVSAYNEGAGILSGSINFNDFPPEWRSAFSCVDGYVNPVVVPCTYSNILPDAYQTMFIRFMPTVVGQLGTISGNIHFTNNTVPSDVEDMYFEGGGNNVGFADLENDHINFGNVLVGDTITRTFTVTNSGVALLNGSVTVDDATDRDSIAGPDGVFLCTSANCAGFSIPAGGSEIFTFTFTPTASPLPDFIDSDLQIDTHAHIAGESLHMIGWSHEPVIEFLPDGWSGNTFPANYGRIPYFPPTNGVLNKSFSVANVGNAWSALRYNIINSAHFRCIQYCSGDLHAYSITDEGISSNPAMYPVIQFNPGVDGPGTYTENVTVEYWKYTFPYPVASYDDYGEIYYPDTDGVRYTLVRQLTAETGAFASWSMTGIPVSFTNVPVSTVQTNSFTITNDGAVDLVIDNFSTDGNFTCSTSQFGVYTANCISGLTLTHGMTAQTVYIKYAPNAPAPLFTKNYTMNIRDPISASTTARNIRVRASANAVPVMSVFPLAYDFDLVQVGAASPKVFQVSNTGSVPLAAATVSLSDANFKCVDPISFVERSSCTIPSVAANSSVNITLVFRPHDANTYAAIATFSGNQAGVGNVSVDLQGRGDIGVSDFGSLETDFGKIKVNKVSERKLIPIKNLGNASFGSGWIDISVGEAGTYQCVSSSAGIETTGPHAGKCKYALGANGSVDASGNPLDTTNIEVIFSPKSRGFKTGIVTFTGVQGASFTLTGTGVVTNVNFKEQ
jgi:hypothetical protein